MRASRAKVAGLQDAATIRGTLLSASMRACASAPCRGGSNTTTSKLLSSAGTSGRRNKSRVCASIGLSPWVARAAAANAETASPSLSAAQTRARSASRSANGPTPQNRSATLLALSQWVSISIASAASPAAVACRKAPGGSANRARPIRIVAVTREAGEAPALCHAGELAGSGGAQRPRVAHVDVEPVVGRRHLDIERLADAAEGFGDGPGRLDRAVQARRQDRAAVDRHQVVRLERGKSDLEHVMGAASRMEDRSAAAVAMGIDERID